MNKEATVQISPQKKILSKAQPPPENKAHLLNQFDLLFPCYVLMIIKNLKLRVPSTSATLAAQNAPQSSFEKQQKPAAKEDLSLSLTTADLGFMASSVSITSFSNFCFKIYLTTSVFWCS